MSSACIFINRLADRSVHDNGLSSSPPDDVLYFHRNVLPGYKPSPLTAIHAPSPTTTAGAVGRVLVKQESNRCGLPAFKVLGNSYAAFHSLCSIYRCDVGATSLDELRHRIQANTATTPTLVTATDGNHGRSLAWFAHQLGLPARIFVPQAVAKKAVECMRAEGADVVQLTSDYDDAVRQAAQFTKQHTHALLIQDTSWEGYSDVPRRIVQGYATIFHEIQQSEPNVTHIVCPVGVGSLAQACVQFTPAHVRILSVEPTTATCLFTSLQNGRATTVDTHSTIMAGLNCGSVSHDAWPLLQRGVSAAVLVTDDETRTAMIDLHTQHIDAGPCGAAPLAALRVLLADAQAREDVGIDAQSTVVLLATEGKDAS